MSKSSSLLEHSRHHLIILSCNFLRNGNHPDPFPTPNYCNMHFYYQELSTHVVIILKFYLLFNLFQFCFCYHYDSFCHRHLGASRCHIHWTLICPFLLDILEFSVVEHSFLKCFFSWLTSGFHHSLFSCCCWSYSFIQLWNVVQCSVLELFPWLILPLHLSDVILFIPFGQLVGQKVHLVFFCKIKDTFFIWTNNFIDLDIWICQISPTVGF